MYLPRSILQMLGFNTDVIGLVLLWGTFAFLVISNIYALIMCLRKNKGSYQMFLAFTFAYLFIALIHTLQNDVDAHSYYLYLAIINLGIGMILSVRKKD